MNKIMLTLGLASFGVLQATDAEVDKDTLKEVIRIIQEQKPASAGVGIS